MVRLLQSTYADYPTMSSSFNPTMVRLLHLCACSKLRNVPVFQSHNGAIAAAAAFKRLAGDNLVSIPQWCDCCSLARHCGVAVVKFQSHNGAIAAHCRIGKADTAPSVSIPQWCDCCVDKYGAQATVVTFQSHNGAIAAC